MIRPDSAYSWLVAVATLILASLSFGAANSVPILYPEIAGEFGWGSSKVASLYAATMVGGAIASLCLGRALDRIGFFKIGVVATCATCGGMLLASRATNLWQFYLIYGVLVGGLGQGAFLSTLAAAVSQWFVRHRAMAVAIALCGQGVGGLCIPPLLRAWSDMSGWRDALWMYALSCVVLMGASILLFSPRPPGEAGAAPQGRSDPADAASLRSAASLAPVPSDRRLPAPSPWLIVVLFIVLWGANSATVGVSSHLVAYGAMAGLTPVLAGTLMSVHYGVVLLARLSAGYWLDRVDHYSVLLVTTGIQIFGTLVVVFADSVTMVVVGAMAIGVGFGGYLPAYGAIVQSRYPRSQVGRRTTELYLASFVGAGGGTWMVGALWEAGDGTFDLAFATMAALSVMAMVVLVSARSLIKPQPVSGR